MFMKHHKKCLNVITQSIPSICSKNKDNIFLKSGFTNNKY